MERIFFLFNAVDGYKGKRMAGVPHSENLFHTEPLARRSLIEQIISILTNRCLDKSIHISCQSELNLLNHPEGICHAKNKFLRND